MTPVETVWIGLVVVFAIVGIVRGFLKELGVTLVLVVLLFALTRLADYMPKLLDFVTSASKLPVRQWVDREPVWLLFYLLIVLAVAFIAYEGYVIKYPGADPKGIQGILLSLMVGVINGYMLAGALWYYVDKYKATVEALGLLQGGYTPLAEKLVMVLPQAMLKPYLPFLVVFMVVLLVIK